MNNIEEIKKKYFNYYCSIGAYIKDNGIINSSENNIVQIMKEHEEEWTNEFQNYYFSLLQKNNSIIEYTNLLTTIIISSKNLEQLYRLEKIIINDINNKKFADDFLVGFFYKIFILELPLKYTNDKTIISLLDYLKSKNLHTDLNQLLDITVKILNNDNNNNFSYLKRKIIKHLNNSYKKYIFF